MRAAGVSALLVGVLVGNWGCKKEVEPKAQPAPASAPAPAAVATPIWYRAVIRASDGTEAAFFLGVPASRDAAILRVGGHDVRSAATFDGTSLAVPFEVHQTALEGRVGPDGTLTGQFTTSWRAWGTAALPLTGTRVEAPTTGALATLPPGGAPIDLGERRTVWRLAMKESGEAKLAVEQTAPGEFAGFLQLETGNIVYLGGNGRGDRIALTGFDGTSGYRLELVFADAERQRATGTFVGGHRLDWRETLTAQRGPDFDYRAKPAPTEANNKIGLPDHPELAALGPGPIVVELAGSWCSTCRNAAPFLVEVHREYQARGLKLVTLLYEFTDDAEVDAKQAATFKRDYGVVWPVIPVRGGTDVFAEIMPSGLSHLDPSGFPVTLFLRADRTLMAMHAGFPAADAPEEYKRVTAEFRANIEKLLAK